MWISIHMTALVVFINEFFFAASSRLFFGSYAEVKGMLKKY